jgi:hypothetical protein
MDGVRQWLVFLRERQPHLHIRLGHLSNMLDASTKVRQVAVKRLVELTADYPEDYLVFKTKQRLLGK